jgi:signal transduction histidine kinase
LQEAIADIDEEIVRLNRIVNEVLDFARPIRFEKMPTDLNDLCRESAAAAQAAPGVPLQLDLDPSLAELTTDPERLRVVLVNLLVNARHAVNGSAVSGRGESNGDGSVVLSTRAAQGRAMITVADTGVGIEPADLPRVFDPFFTTKRGGTGLGLPIAKNVVEGLGGSISAASAPGRGTEMRIELPLTPSPGPLTETSNL